MQSYDSSPLTPCACGCGQLLSPIDSRGRPRAFRRGHNRFSTVTAGKPYPLTTAERFWSKVDRSGECWLWIGARKASGYGTFYVKGGRAAPQIVFAHRMAYELTYGALPDTYHLHVCHHCDNPSCVRPDHLFLGSDADNIRDMLDKGRGQNRPKYEPGEGNPNAKLTAEVVKRIRERYVAGGVSYHQLAAEFNVTGTLIGYVVRRQIWRHVG